MKMIQTIEETNRNLYKRIAKLETEIESKKFICISLDMEAASRQLKESLEKVQVCDSMVTIKKSDIPIGSFKVTKNTFGKSKWKEPYSLKNLIKTYIKH